MLQENLLYFEEENVSIADFFLIILFIWDVSNIIYFKGYIPIADLKSFRINLIEVINQLIIPGNYFFINHIIILIEK